MTFSQMLVCGCWKVQLLGSICVCDRWQGLVGLLLYKVSIITSHSWRILMLWTLPVLLQTLTYLLGVVHSFSAFCVTSLSCYRSSVSDIPNNTKSICRKPASTQIHHQGLLEQSQVRVKHSFVTGLQTDELEVFRVSLLLKSCTFTFIFCILW